MDKKYLPSKQFVARVIIIAIIVAIIFGAYEITKYFKNRPTQKTQTKLVIKDIVQKDSNNNGIPDWEEILWGLNPSKDGESNKEFILAKQEALSKENGDSSVSTSQNTENEILSQSFFSIVMSLQQTGNLDETSMSAISEAIGQKIVASPIVDSYTKNMLIVKATTATSVTKYYADLKNLMLQYKDKDIGNELTFIAQGLSKNDPQALYVAGTVADEYKSFADALIKIPVPETISTHHLSMANNYDKVAQSIRGLTKIIDDPLTGMKALINYKKYSDALVVDITYFSDNLK